MSVLSEWDIIEELGNRIFIYPFNKETSIRGCSLVLTASEYAYAFTTDPSGTQKTLHLLKSSRNRKYIEVPPRETAIVWTNESILLKDCFCGSIHSKVKWVSLGIGHIGTRVNPNYGGVLAIALHNYADKVVEIDVGDTIAYLIIHRLSSKSSFSQQTDDPGKLREAIPDGYVPPSELSTWVSNSEWRKGIESNLSEKLNETNQQGVNELKSAKDALDSYKNEEKNIIQRFLESRIKITRKWDAMTWITLFMFFVALPPFIDWIIRLISTE